MIPSCNTRFAKVKFRLKTTQLEAISKLPRGETIQVQLPCGEFHEAIVQGVVVQGGYLRAIVRAKLRAAFFLGETSRGAIVRGGISCEQLSGLQLSRGNCH